MFGSAQAYYPDAKRIFADHSAADEDMLLTLSDCETKLLRTQSTTIGYYLGAGHEIEFDSDSAIPHSRRRGSAIL